MRKAIEKKICIKCGRKIQKSNYTKHLLSCDGIKRERFKKLQECPFCHLDISKIKGGNHIRWCLLNPKSKEYRTGKCAWNKGKTKENNEIVKKIAETRKQLYKEGKLTVPENFKGGHKITQNTKNKLSKAQKKRFEEGKHKGWSLINSDINRRSYPEKWFIENVIEKYNLHDKFTIKEKMPFGKYFFDFAFLELNLDLEIDGNQHYSPSAIEHDKIRDEYSKSKNWIVCRLNWKKLKDDQENELQKFLKLVL